ncbi:MAG: hypothetical protein U5J98_00345 [Halobacteriales archaeon]|nr:hypothetical protein [Halobacteriales archaeon]
MFDDKTIHTDAIVFCGKGQKEAKDPAISLNGFRAAALDPDKVLIKKLLDTWLKVHGHAFFDEINCVICR